jgi:hypothetical protein
MRETGLVASQNAVSGTLQMICCPLMRWRNNYLRFADHPDIIDCNTIDAHTHEHASSGALLTVEWLSRSAAAALHRNS